MDTQLLYGSAEAEKEYIGEKIFGLTLPQQLMGKAGAGSLDGLIERGIRSAVNKIESEFGQKAVGGIATWLASGVTEGAEEAIGDWIENTVINPYLRTFDPDTRTIQQKVEDAWHDFLVGGLSGLMGGVTNLIGYEPSPAQNEQSAFIAPTASSTDETASDQLIRAGATQEEAARLAPAVEAVLNGQQIGSNQAGAIVRSKAAISTLEAATGKTINTDAPLSEVKKAVKALVARQEAPAEQAAVDTTAAQAAPAEAQRVSADARSGSFSARAGDRTTVEDFARDMNRAGASVLTSMYADGQDVEQYLGGMMKAYHAGLNGNEPVSAAALQRYDVNRAQAEAAYMAGQADAAASLAKERRAAQFAKTAGADSGLVYDEYVANKMDSASADEMNAVSKALGVRVRMVDGTQVLGGQANGQITGSDILIAKDAQDPVLRVVGHEWTHRVQELAPEQYRTFRNAVGSLPDVQGAAQILLKQYRAAGVEISYEQALDEAAANYAGDMIGNSGVLDDFIRKNRANRTLLEKLRDAIHEIVGKLTGRARQQAQTVEGKLQAAFEAASKQAESLRDRAGNDTMSAARNSLEEDSEDGREGAQGTGRFAREEAPDRRGERAVRGTAGEALRGDAVSRGERGGLSASFGQKPVRSWAEGRTVEPAKGSVAYEEQQTAVDYGVPSFVVADAAWAENKNGTPAFSVDGQIYFRETLPEKNRGMFAPHEITHVMRQVSYKPYLDFVERTPAMLDMSTLEARILLENSAKHRGIDLSGTALSEADRLKLYDELNATLYGHISSGKMDGLNEVLHQAFHDFDAYAKELGELHERFKIDKLLALHSKNTATEGGEARYSLNERFSQQFDDWLAKKTDNKGAGSFLVGTTSDALKSIGVSDYEIYWRKAKIAKIMNEHPAMTADVIKSVPNVLEHPILVMQSQTVANRITLFGETVDAEGKPVLAALELSPQSKRGEIQNFAVIASAYGKNNAQQLIDNSEILYVDPNKKRTTNWLGLLRLQLPSSLTSYGSISRVTLVNRDVNGNLSFGEGSGKAAMQEAFEKAKEKTGFSLKTPAEEAKFSLKGTENAQELAALKRENESLRERVEYWRGQTRRSKGVTTDRASVSKAADALVKDYGAEISGSDIAGDLQSLYDYIAGGGDGKNELTYTEARRRADAIAERIAESAVGVDDQVYRDYADLRKYLKDTKLTLSEEDAADITDYADFRKAQFGRLRISKGRHTNVDQVFSELSEQYPEFFSEQLSANVSDQLQRIADVASQLYAVTEYNPFEGYMGQAVASISNDIMDRFFDLPQTKKTFADRAAEQVQAAKQAGREAAGDAFLAGQMAQGRQDAKRLLSAADALAKERSRRAEQVQALKERYREKDANRRENQRSRELRAKIIRHANALSRKLLRPTDKQHIPEGMRTAVAKVLESINRESRYTVDADGKRTYDADGTPTKRTQAWMNLKEQYQRIAAEDGMVVDPSLFGMDRKEDGQTVSGGFDQVIAMGDTRLSDLTREQLATMWNVLKSVEHSVTTAGKTLSSTKFSTTKQFADALQADALTRSGKHGQNLSISLETPYTFFSHFGQTGRDVYRMLRDAQDRQELMSRDIEEKVHRILGEKETGRGVRETLEAKRGNAVWKLNTDTREFTTAEGKSLTLTPAQAMEIYLLSRRQQAQAHLMQGGIVQPEIRDALTGKVKIERGTEAIRLSAEDLKAISDSLTGEQVRMADELQKLTAGALADYGNEASMKAYGYRKFTEKNYWPIHSAKEALHSSAEKSGDNVRSIKNIGMAQAVTPNANTTLDISGVFDTFSQHASDMIDYAAWLCPMEDANRLFNFEYRDAKGNWTGRTVKGLLEDKGGKGAQAYWTKLMNDLQNGIGNRGFEPLTRWFSKYVGRFKGAAVGANIRVIVQQPTAFFRASVALAPADMAKGLTGGVTKGSGWEKALKYSPIAMRKDVGSFDISSPYTLSDRFYGQTGFSTKLNELAGKGAGAADAMTWGALWNACEWQVKREKPDLRAGSGEFYSEVNRVFTDMIDQTQVVDGILQRSNIMRGERDLAQQATAFMGEPIMSLNVLMRSYDQFKYEQNPGKRGKDLKKLGRAVTALLATNVINAAVQSVIDGIRDDDRDKDYWERVLAAFTGVTGDEENWAQYLADVTMNGNLIGNMNPLEQVPFVKDVWSIWQGYDISRPDMETFSDLVDAAKTAVDSAGGNGKKTGKEALIGLFAAAGKMLGLPVYNIKRDAMALLRTAAAQSGSIPFQYELEKFTYNIGSEKNKSRFLALLYDALEQGDYASFERIRGDLMDRMGVDGVSIDRAMRSRYSKAQEKEPAYTLPQRARDLIGSPASLAAEEETDDAFGADDLDAAGYRAYSEQRADAYRSMSDRMDKFGGLDDAARDKALNAALSLAEDMALRDQSGGQFTEGDFPRWERWAAGGADYGVDETEAILFKLAYEMAQSERNRDGSIVQGSKQKNTLATAERWMPGLTDRELEYLMSNFWAPEDKALAARKESGFMK